MGKILQVGVKILLLTSDKKQFVAIKRNSSTSLDVDESYDIPGGRIELGEEPIEGLKRELVEEINYNLSGNPKLIDASNIVNNGDRQIIRLTYWSIEKVSIKDIAIGDEHSSAKLIPLEESSGFHPLLNNAIRILIHEKVL